TDREDQAPGLGRDTTKFRGLRTVRSDLSPRNFEAGRRTERQSALQTRIPLRLRTARDLRQVSVESRQMLKIESIRTANGCPRLKVAGRVIGPWVAELRLAWQRALVDGRGLALDLSEVAFVAPTGLEVLCMVSPRGVAPDCPAFVARQLRARGRP